MRISTSSVNPLRPSAGFTLIEILIVVVLVGIIMGVVISSFTGVDQEQVLRGYAERLTLRIELARDKALQANREWGMYVDEAGVRFAVYDENTGEWIPQSGKHFVADEYGASLEFEVEVESFEGQLATTEPDPFDTGRAEEEFPTIVLFSSGETTPFTISLAPRDWQTAAWQLTSDGFSRTTLSRAEQI